MAAQRAIQSGHHRRIPVITTGYKAEFGMLPERRHVITKSGSNDIHGLAPPYHRNNALRQFGHFRKGVRTFALGLRLAGGAHGA